MNKLVSLTKFYGLGVFSIICREIYFQFARKFLSRDALLARVYDYKMWVPLRHKGIGRPLYVLRERELDHKWMIDQEVVPGNVILDLGVNIGYYAIMEAQRLNGNGKIYTIEPDMRNIEFLKRNISLNGLDKTIDCEVAAMSNLTGHADFSLAESTDLNSFAIKGTSAAVGSVRVKVYDFGDYLKKKERIDLVRMDIEGHELEVLQSLAMLMREASDIAPRKIIFEVHLYKDPKSMAAVLEELFNFGYMPKYVSSYSEDAIVGANFRNYGYKPFKIIKDWPVVRGLYRGLDQQHAIDLISQSHVVKTVCLELEPIS